MTTASRSGLVAVLFTDLVGSTKLMSQLGDRAFDELRRQHFAALSRAVAAHGGEEVKNTGDGILAVFPSAAEAVEAAVAMQQATVRQKSPLPLAMRVGVAVGDATLEERDVFGASVVEAARLVGAAEAGQILVTSVVRMLAGSRSTAGFADLGFMELKGLPEPVAVCEVAWEPLAGSQVPMPELLTDVGPIFVGRDAQLERLGQLWKEAAAGERRVAMLAGEPGVGKTRLAAELATHCHEEGAIVLAGRCDEDLGVPFQPFVEALRHFVDHTPAEDLHQRLGRYGSELVRLLPELTQRVPDLPPPLTSDPETERYRLFEAVSAWLAAASSEQPLLIILDDLQWAAKPTLLVLRHVAQATELHHVLILGTYRDTDLTHGHPLVAALADLRRYRQLERLLVTGLDGLGVREIVEQAADQPLDEAGVALAHAIYQETEGNPLFVRELLRHLMETNAVERRSERWVTRFAFDDLGIPESVRDVIGRRLSRLSDDANHALRVAAVVGAEFDVNLVQAAGSIAESELLADLDEAIEGRLVTEVSATRFRFAHALVRTTLYESLSGARKVALHRHVAEQIEAIYRPHLDDHLPALAHHWSRAAPAGDAEKAVHYLARAGGRALEQLAHDEAVGYYTSAVELLAVSGAPADDRQRVELLICLGEAQRRAGLAVYRQTLLDAAALAQRQRDASALARAALANHPGFTFSVPGATDRERVRILEAALSAIGPADSPVRARLLATLALELFWEGDLTKRLRLSEEASAMARRLGDPTTRVAVLSTRPYAIAAPHTVEARLADTAELLDATAAMGDPAAASAASVMRARVLIEAGRIQEAEEALHVAFERADESGQPALRFWPTWMQASLAVFHGRLVEAENRAQSILTVGQLCQAANPGLYHALVQFQLRYEQGRLAEIEDSFRATVGGVPLGRPMLALLHCELNRRDEAREVLDQLLEENLESLPMDGTWLRMVTDLSAVAAGLRHVGAAAALYDLLRPYPIQFPIATAITGCVAHYLGLLATTLERFDAAERWFSTAQTRHHDTDAPAWLARTRLEWARMLLTRGEPGDEERFRELLGQALAIARGLGLGMVERRAVALLELR